MKYRRISGCVIVTGPPRGDLLAENGHDAACGAQNVAEADRHEARARPRGKALNIELRHPLGGAHDRCGIHRFVRTDHHKGIRTMLVARICNDFGTKHVVFYGFPGIPLHHRHVLMGGSVKHCARPMARKELGDAVGIRHVGDAGDNLEVGVLSPQFSVYLEQCVL